jgi:hypothetical protein
MARVYSCATHVIIWLGEGESEGQDEAIATLVSYDWIKHMLDTESPATIIDSDGQSLKVLEAFRSLESLEIASYAGAPMFCGRVFAKDDQENPDIAREVSTIISTACRIFMRRYWERRWIVQELYHATPKATEIRWGPCVFEGLEKLNLSFLSRILGCADSLIPYRTDLLDFGIVSRAHFEQVSHTRLIRKAIDDISDLRRFGFAEDRIPIAKSCRSTSKVQLHQMF